MPLVRWKITQNPMKESTLILLCDRIKQTELPAYMSLRAMDFISKDSFGCTSHKGQLSDDKNVRNGVRHWGISPRTLFNFYLSEVISESYMLSVWCTINCSEINILGYVDDLVLVAPAAQALQLLLNALTFKLYTLSLQVNVQKKCSFCQ